MNKEQKEIRDTVIESINALGLDYTEEQLVKSLNLLYRQFPQLTIKYLKLVCLNASTGKYGIPYKFVPALVGQWFHKERKEIMDAEKGRL